MNELLDDQPKELTRTQQWQIKQAKEQIVMAERVLYGMCLLSAYEIFTSWNFLTGVDLGIMLSFLVFYLLAAIGTRYKPLLATSAALTVYLLVQLLLYFISDASFLAGILWKIVIIAALSAGLLNSVKIWRIEKSVA